LIRHQKRVRPVVLAREITRPDEFPVPALAAFGSSGARVRARLERARARRAGFATPRDWKLTATARAYGCELLHAHFGITGYWALAARERLGVPLVTTFYGFDLSMPSREPGWAENYSRLFAEGERFVVEGPHMAETLAGIGAPREKIEVVRIGLDLELFPFEPRVPSGPLVILQAARLVPKKGVDLSIQAFAAARSRLGEAELWVIGDGPERDALDELAARLGIASAVRFLGGVSYDAYQDAVRRAHVCIQPSRTAPDGDTEGGAPTVILEMQASGRPVVATRHADIPFVVARPDELADEEDVEGLAAQLVRLTELSPDEWRDRAQAARSLVEAEHDARRQAARVEDLYFLGT
jgi:colanic acid/amylovoran biosynthesis glycosyltransferase